ncbi:MAG: MBL fold metallo-hydrolase [Desulfomonile tiedjei]|nr:MBL fold metallo-hydrolase [Desulfomonile tiedjei]
MTEDKSDTFPRLLTDGLWVVGNYYFNSYLVKGEQATALIDVGVSAVVDDVIRQLDSLRIAPTFLVVTHPHTDHVTGLDGLQVRYPQALIVAAEGAADFLAHPKAGEVMALEDLHMADFLASKGLNPGRRPIEEPPSLNNCLIAKDGYEMDLGGLTLRFISVTGHAPGEIVAHIPEIDALILSDSLGFRYPGRGVFPLFFTNYSDYIASLDRLRNLRAKIVGVAHQGPLSGAQIEKAFEESGREAMRLRDKIRLDSRDDEEVAADVFKEYYKDELMIYTPENIMNCARLLVRRARE